MSSKLLPLILLAAIPTSSENLAAGYHIGQQWMNTITGVVYIHHTDGVWITAATPHASTHYAGGSDEVSISAVQVTDSTPIGRSMLMAATQAAIRSVLNYDVVNPMDPTYGAIGDGSTDDTAAFTAADATGKVIQLPPGKTFKLNGFILANSPAIIGSSGSTIKVVNNTVGIYVARDSTVINNVRFIGDGKASGYTSQCFIDNYKSPAVYGSVRGIIDSCYFNDCGGDPIRYSNIAPSGDQSGNIISSCVFESCYKGPVATTRGESMTVNGCTMHSCTYGVQVGAGNCQLIGNKIVNCVDGINVIAGVNDSHGVAIGNLLLHCTYPIDVNGIVNGFVFSGNTIYQGTINLVNTRGVQISDGLLDPDAYSFNGSLGTVIKNNLMPYGYANTVSNNVGGNQSRTIWNGNRDLTGKVRPTGWQYQIDGSFVRSDYVGGSAQVISIGATSVLVPGVLTLNLTNGNSGYTADLFYNTSTGAYSVIGYGPGKVHIKFNVYITGSGTLSLAYMAIRKNSTIVEFVPPDFLNNLYYFFFDGTVHADPGDTIDFILGNNSGGTITIPATTDSWFEIEGL